MSHPFMLLGIPEGSGELAIKGIYGWENFEIKLRETCIRFLIVKMITFKCFLTSLKFVLPGMWTCGPSLWVCDLSIGMFCNPTSGGPSHVYVVPLVVIYSI